MLGQFAFTIYQLFCSLFIQSLLNTYNIDLIEIIALMEIIKSVTFIDDLFALSGRTEFTGEITFRLEKKCVNSYMK